MDKTAHAPGEVCDHQTPLTQNRGPVPTNLTAVLLQITSKVPLVAFSLPSRTSKSLICCSFVSAAVLCGPTRLTHIALTSHSAYGLKFTGSLPGRSKLVCQQQQIICCQPTMLRSLAPLCRSALVQLDHLATCTCGSFASTSASAASSSTGSTAAAAGEFGAPTSAPAYVFLNNTTMYS